MTSRDFCFWLQGLFEVADPKTLNAKQVKMIKTHLHMVFEHEITPSFEDAEELEKTHSGTEFLDSKEIEKKLHELAKEQVFPGKAIC